MNGCDSNFYYFFSNRSTTTLCHFLFLFLSLSLSLSLLCSALSVNILPHIMITLMLSFDFDHAKDPNSTRVEGITLATRSNCIKMLIEALNKSYASSDGPAQDCAAEARHIEFGTFFAATSSSNYRGAVCGLVRKIEKSQGGFVYEAPPAAESAMAALQSKTNVERSDASRVEQNSVYEDNVDMEESEVSEGSENDEISLEALHSRSRRKLSEAILTTVGSSPCHHIAKADWAEDTGAAAAPNHRVVGEEE